MADVDWEISKENIQPRKEGRDISSVMIGLTPRKENMMKLHNEQQQFELALRANNGSDPMEIWYRYLVWTEHHSPEGSSTEVKNLIERCIQFYKDDDRYKNDKNYLYIWLKYADTLKDPTELFNYMFSQEIGTQHSLFYENWAFLLAQMGNYAKADEVFSVGIARKAQPLERLQRHHRDFEKRLMTLIKESEEIGEEPAQEESRVSLAPLKKKSKGAVSHDRVKGKSQISSGGLKMSKSVNQASNVNQMSNGAFAVFSDENAPASKLPTASGEWKQPPTQTAIVKENTQKPGKWNNCKISSSQAIKSSQKQQFNIHIDDEDVEKQPEMAKQLVMSERKPLSVKKIDKKASQDNPLQPFTKQNDSNIQVMYCKDQVYMGNLEFSLEELRTLAWMTEYGQTSDDVTKHVATTMVLDETLMNEVDFQKEVEDISGACAKRDIQKQLVFKGEDKNAVDPSEAHEETQIPAFPSISCLKSPSENMQKSLPPQPPVSPVDAKRLMDKDNQHSDELDLNDFEDIDDDFCPIPGRYQSTAIVDVTQMRPDIRSLEKNHEVLRDKEISHIQSIEEFEKDFQRIDISDGKQSDEDVKGILDDEKQIPNATFSELSFNFRANEKRQDVKQSNLGSISQCLDFPMVLSAKPKFVSDVGITQEQEMNPLVKVGVTKEVKCNDESIHNFVQMPSEVIRPRAMKVGAAYFDQNMENEDVVALGMDKFKIFDDVTADRIAASDRENTVGAFAKVKRGDDQNIQDKENYPSAFKQPKREDKQSSSSQSDAVNQKKAAIPFNVFADCENDAVNPSKGQCQPFTVFADCFDEPMHSLKGQHQSNLGSVRSSFNQASSDVPKKTALPFNVFADNDEEPIDAVREPCQSNLRSAASSSNHTATTQQAKAAVPFTVFADSDDEPINTFSGKRQLHAGSAAIAEQKKSAMPFTVFSDEPMHSLKGQHQSNLGSVRSSFNQAASDVPKKTPLPSNVFADNDEEPINDVQEPRQSNLGSAASSSNHTATARQTKAALPFSVFADSEDEPMNTLSEKHQLHAGSAAIADPKKSTLPFTVFSDDDDQPMSAFKEKWQMNVGPSGSFSNRPVIEDQRKTALPFTVFADNDVESRQSGARSISGFSDLAAATEQKKSALPFTILSDCDDKQPRILQEQRQSNLQAIDDNDQHMISGVFPLSTSSTENHAPSDEKPSFTNPNDLKTPIVIRRNSNSRKALGDFPLMSNNVPKSPIWAPSPTMNTKKAQQEILAMFNETLDCNKYEFTLNETKDDISNGFEQKFSKQADGLEEQFNNQNAGGNAFKILNDSEIETSTCANSTQNATAYTTAQSSNFDVFDVKDLSPIEECSDEDRSRQHSQSSSSSIFEKSSNISPFMLQGIEPVRQRVNSLPSISESSLYNVNESARIIEQSLGVLNAESLNNNASINAQIENYTTAPPQSANSDLSFNGQKISQFEHLTIAPDDSSQAASDGLINRPKIINPFDINRMENILLTMDFERGGKFYEMPDTPCEKFAVNYKVQIGNDTFKVLKRIAEGGFSTVYLCNSLNQNEADAESQSKAVFKVMKSETLCRWEFYISEHLRGRIKEQHLNPYLLGSFICPTRAYTFADGSIIEYPYYNGGTLLDWVNRCSQNKINITEEIAMAYAAEICTIVNAAHDCCIIHGDIKPDNFLIRNNVEDLKKIPRLTLADFGRSIDLTVLQPSVVFSGSCNTDQFECIEMRQNLPWKYQIDYFGVACTIHVILYGSYMNLVNIEGKHRVCRNVRRGWDKKFWNSVFDRLINSPDCNRQTVLGDLCKEFEERLYKVR